MPAARDLLNAVSRACRTARTMAPSAPWRLAVFAAVALCATWVLLSTAPALNEFRDAQVLGHYESAAREALLRWHQAPLWDPYYCGGMYLLGTPQARFVSPTFLLTLLFGEERGEALTAFAMILVGLEGTYRYARSRGATAFGAVLGAPVFALSGIFAIAPSLGWTNFFGFELLPWVALGVRRALRGEARGALLAAAAMAWCTCMGGTYSAPLAALWGAFEGLELLVLRGRRRAWRRVGVGAAFSAAAGLLAAGLSAVRLWPVADAMTAAPRIIGGTPGNPWSRLAGMLFLGPAHDSPDGTFFIGLCVLPALLVGIPRRRSIPLVAAGVIWGWLACGYAVRPCLFAALRALPLYETLRFPERFLIPMALVVAVLAARGIGTIEARRRLWARRGRARRSAIALGLLVGAAFCLVLDVGPLVNLHLIHALNRSLSPAPVGDASRPFHQSRGNRWALGYYEPMQRGSLSCWEAYPVPESPLLRGDLASEESVIEPGAGTVTEQSWSPDAITLDVDLSRPATVAVNQNYAPGWRASVGTVADSRGLLTVALPAGKQTVTLRFLPRSAVGGGLASLVALAAVGWLAWRTRRRPDTPPWMLGVAALVPAIPAAIVAASMHEARPAEPLIAQDGKPVIADAVSPRATPLDVTFEGGIHLDAAFLSSDHPFAGTDLTLELDWRRDAEIEKGLGVFMHLVPSNGKPMNGDHALLSAVLDMDVAPPDKTLRDVMPLWMPEDSHGVTWQVWVGLWRVRHGGERVRIVDPGHGTIDEDRVLVGTVQVR